MNELYDDIIDALINEINNAEIEDLEIIKHKNAVDYQRMSLHTQNNLFYIDINRSNIDGFKANHIDLFIAHHEFPRRIKSFDLANANCFDNVMESIINYERK